MFFAEFCVLNEFVRRIMKGIVSYRIGIVLRYRYRYRIEKKETVHIPKNK